MKLEMEEEEVAESFSAKAKEASALHAQREALVVERRTIERSLQELRGKIKDLQNNEIMS